MKYELHYTRYPLVVTGYYNANWISDSQETKSISVYIFTLGGAVTSWKLTNKMCITLCTIELEFIALDKAREEVE